MKDQDLTQIIDLSNMFLFPHLELGDIGELLPGRLFTTRMPRNISDPKSAEKFKHQKEFYDLHSALVLTGL